MAEQGSKDAAARDRIIRHLNADHQKSLSYYLRHYSKLSASAASKPIVRDVTFEALTINSADGKSHTIPFSPPMQSWADARTRTVDMDCEARSALGISPINITAYEPPGSPLHVMVAGLCLFTAVVFVTQSRIVEGTWVYDKALPFFPGGPESFRWLVKVITPPVFVIHVGEAFLLDRIRLSRHGVERGTALWWKWISSCFIEGFPCFQRIDAAIKRKTLEAEKAKH